MKKLFLAVAMAAFATGAFADEQAPVTGDEKAKAVDVAKPRRPPRPAFDRAKFEETMKQRRAERLAKVLEAIKAAGISDEAKAKELAETIDKLYARPARPPRPPRAAKPAEAPAEKK